MKHTFRVYLELNKEGEQNHRIIEKEFDTKGSRINKVARAFVAFGIKEGWIAETDMITDMKMAKIK